MGQGKGLVSLTGGKGDVRKHNPGSILKPAQERTKWQCSERWGEKPRRRRLRRANWGLTLSPRRKASCKLSREVRGKRRRAVQNSTGEISEKESCARQSSSAHFKTLRKGKDKNSSSEGTRKIEFLRGVRCSMLGLKGHRNVRPRKGRFSSNSELAGSEARGTATRFEPTGWSERRKGGYWIKCGQAGAEKRSMILTSNRKKLLSRRS